MPEPAPAARAAKPILFISDLHLAASRPRIAEVFHRLLQNEAMHAQALYILGDLFEYWVGDEDAADPFNAGVLSALGRVAASGVPVSLMHGNRDFLVGRKAAQQAGITLIADPTLIDAFGTRTLLMHGDTLCTDDHAYQQARARWRRPIVLRIFLSLPHKLRLRIGAKAREVSERVKSATPAQVMDVNQDAVEQVLRTNGYPRLIHGHTHRPARHVHRIDGYECERWVLADWYQRGSYLRCDADGCRAVMLD